MSQDSPERVVERAYDTVWDDGDTDAVSDLYASDYSANLPNRPEARSGPDGLAAYVDSLHDSFPDLSVSVDERVVGDGAVSTRWTAVGTHENDHMGLEATGEEVEMYGMSIDHVAEGEITESWINLDVLGVLRQLGHSPL